VLWLVVVALAVVVVAGQIDHPVGGGARSAELTLPGFVHDVCSAIHPMAISSPLFRTLPLQRHGLRWIHPPSPLAHPLDNEPAVLVENSLAAIESEDLATIIYTSGTTGEPKGVMLTHGNISHNVEAIRRAIRLTRQDVVIGVLPFFHSFGYTVTLWGVMTIGPAGIYHYNPLEARQIGKLAEKYGATVLLGTPTFLRGYLRKIEPEQFSKLDVVVVGAEKMPADLFEAFEKRFGVRPVEGYGTTELSPLVSVNIPPNRSSHELQKLLKEGTVGRPIPNVAARITDPEDDAKELGQNEPGMLWL
jgi:acyl-[acyl-carrier-protein]-phospholipid O-acyltransferase / long-chain-fatty-acid--[acyl-carrier-protein] ligase